MSLQELQQVRDFLAANPEAASIEESRARYDGLQDLFPTPADVARETVDVAGRPAEWLRPAGAAKGRVILYLHGGGYVLGSPASHRHLVAAIARAADAQALVIDYRLAPEHPFPAAVDDALGAYRHLLAAGFAPAQIAFAGDSAGGGLTVATLLAARDAGLPQPACGFCISPWIDLEGLGESMTTKASVDPMVQKAGLADMAGAYLGGASPRTPLAAPLWADLAGLAPLLIQVGGAETLLDDATRLAARAAAADLDVRLECWPHMIHVWHAFHPMLGEAREAIAVAGEYLARRLGAAARAEAA